MAPCRVHYFDIKALGECIRLLLSYGGQEFEDKRYNMEEWQKFKPQTVFGQMPMLEMDGKEYAQSVAISRYLGRKYGISGATPEEDIQIDMMVDFFNDLRSNAAQCHYESDPIVKERKFQEKSEVMANQLAKLDKIIGENDGHLALGRLTWGDFFFAGMYDYMKMMLRRPDLDTTHPNLKKVADNVYSLPKVKAFAEKAPKSEV